LNTYILIYDSFVQFEVTLAAYFMKTKGEVYTLGLEDKALISCEGFSVNPSVLVENVDVSTIDLLIIPGGETDNLIGQEALLDLIRSLNRAGKVIAGICGGVSILKAAGVLDGKVYVDNESGVSNVVVDGTIITAKPNGYVDFALEIGRVMSIYKDEADLQETIDFFKYFKSV
jgi:putative intracellular protease/amidase